MIVFNQFHLLVVGILVVYLLALVDSSGLSVKISPKKFTQYRSQYVVFYCYVTGNPVPIVTWYSKGKDITNNARVKIGPVPGGYIMRLGQVHPFLDNGTLECRGKNGVDSPVSDKAELRILRKFFDVLDPDLPPGIAKPLARYNPNVNVHVGTNITLIVNVSGNPVPKITWFKGKRLLDWSNSRFTLLKNNSLRITNAQVADRGEYDYMAENDKGQIFSRPWIVRVDYIKTKPGFKPGLKNQVVDPETNVVLNCLATGYPKPDVLWKNSKNRTIQEDGLLRITNIQKSETYRCIAKNELGNATISVNVTLSGLPFAPRNLFRKSQTGYSLTVSWQDGAAGTIIDYHEINYRKKGDLYWRTVYNIPGNLREYRLDNLNAYTDYEVQVFAQNKVGKSKGSKIISMMTDETAPGSAPRSIVVKSTETGSFEVSWLPPEYPNGRISFYTIYYTDEPHKSWERWSSTYARKSPRKISGLQSDRRYAVRISSSTGTSAAGPISEPFLVQTLQGAPSNPQNVQAKVISSTKVELSWKKPSYEGSGQGIVGYDIYYNTSVDGTRNKVTIHSPDDFSEVITGLRPATIYKFDIAARTDAGSGPSSFPQFATTWEGAPSAPPNNFSCTAIDASHIHCSWRPPAIKDRNGLIIGYMIRYKLSNKDTFVKKSVTNSVLSMTLGKLQAYTVYHIDIAANSSKGQGPFSDRIAVTTHETKPSKPPENMTATAINSTAIFITWKAPSPPFGAKLTGYQFRHRKKPQEKAYRIINIVGNKRRIVMTSLEPEQDYEFLVAAKSAKGVGKLTEPVVCKTKQAPPKPPVLVSKKLAAPQVGVALKWRSIARDIEQFQLRYAKEVEKITNKTLLSKLSFVEKTFPPSVTSYNVTNLGHGLWYVFKIYVKNVGGWSTDREAWLLMDAAKPTGPPLNFEVEPKTSTSVQLSWDLPEKWKRNGKIIGYELSYLQVGSSAERKIENLDDKRMFELQGLKKFTSYQFRILAKTVAGNGPAVSIEGKTKEDAPSDSPTLTDAKGMGTKVVRLKFKPPSIPNGRIIGYKVNIYMDNPTFAGKWKDDEMDENKNEMYVGKLHKSNFNYWFTVAAKTSVGYGPFSAPMVAKTLSHDLPLPVQKLSADATSSGTVKLKWDNPVDTAAVLSYKISYWSEKIFIGSDKKQTKIKLHEKIKTVSCCKQNSAILENLEPYTEYTVKIVSVGKSETDEASESLKIKTKVASSPVFAQPNISRNGITNEYIPIYVHPASERYGPISHYLIYVASLGKTVSEAREKLRDIKNSRSRRAADANDRDDVYIAGKLEASVVPTTFKVGRGQIENGYTNRRLTVDHFYAFSIQSCVLDENSLCLTTSTAFTDPVEFSVVDPARNKGSGSGNTGNNLWLLGPACGVVLLIIIIVVMCLLWRRRARRRGRKPKSLKEMVHDDQLPMMTSPKDPVEMQRLNLETEGMREHPPIHISDLSAHIEHLRLNNNNGFTREYESIDPSMTFTSEISAHHLNQSKNRYPNIVPYDHTRVVLEDTNGFQDSDYLNANYLAGYRKQNAYIATQAPLTNTINDFWQMIWEQDTRTIVMMTNLQEKGRIKCDQYWPNQSSEKFGSISVVVLETVELAHYTVRTFKICKDGQNDKCREIKQYQYTAWPDHGVPHYSTSLLCFIRKVRLANPTDVGPVIVHCSAGVGRTGVFIVIDSMLEKIRREQTVDVYGHVTLLRSQRNHMVQTEEQYIFIHETLLEAVLFGNTEIHASDLSQYYKKLNEIGVNETTSIEEHFKQLSVFSHTHRFVTPILAANKSKNRYPKIIPYEHSRVDLVPVRSVDGSNYINASYIDGYKHRRTYIAAQGPLEETVNDFWRMIMEKKSNIVVMLTDHDDQQMSATYWPSEKSAKYHFYIVDPVSVEETPNFTLRQFKVNDMMSSCPSLIKLFQLRKWPDRGKPQSYKAILDLIGQVHIARNNDETKGPVVVHCGSGSGRTGVFCALSIVVERMRAEGVVDLLQTVRQLREQRPQMVETLEEYAFCYEAALQYLSSFDHITA